MISTGTCVSAPRGRLHFVFALVVGLAAAACSSGSNPVSSPKIVAGAAHVCAYDVERKQVVCWGDNSYGQLGNEAFAAEGVSVPVRVKSISGRKIKALSAGYAHTCALVAGATDDDLGNTVACWGYNHYGQVGDGSTDDRNVPVFVDGPDGNPLTGIDVISAGAFHTCASMAKGAKDEGKIYCWGRNERGQLGNGSLVNSSEPVMVEGLEYGGGVVAGTAHTCALTAQTIKDAQNGNYRVVCWGDASHGQMRDAAIPGGASYTTTPVDVGLAVSNLLGLISEHVAQADVTTATGKSAAAGTTATETPAYGLTCAVTSDTLQCWGGSNQFGQWGTVDPGATENTIFSSSFYGTFYTVSAGNAQTCVIVGHTATCWGFSSGLGISAEEGTADGVIADNRGRVEVNLTPTGIAVGREFACLAGAKDQPQIWCWGTGAKGQIGNARREGVRVPVCVKGFCPATALNDNQAEGKGFVEAPPPAPSTWRIAVGDDGSCAIDYADIAYCWGKQVGNVQHGNGAAPSWETTAGSVPRPTLVSGAISLQTAGTTHCVLAGEGLTCWGNLLLAGNPGPYPDDYQEPAVWPEIRNFHEFTMSETEYCASQIDGWECRPFLPRGSPAVVYPDAEIVVVNDHSRCVYAWVEAIQTNELRCGTPGAMVKIDVEIGEVIREQIPTYAGTIPFYEWALKGAGGTYCAITPARDVACWRETTGGFTTPETIAGVKGATHLAVGGGHACAVIGNDKVLCWGEGSSGQLGDGKFTDSRTPVEVKGLGNVYSVGAGTNHTCALRFDGSVWCWGRNDLGQLGDGTVENRGVPVYVSLLGFSLSRGAIVTKGTDLVEGHAQQKFAVTIPIVEGDQRYEFDCDGNGDYEVDGKLAGHECFYSRLASGTYPVGYRITYRNVLQASIAVTGATQFTVQNAPPVISRVDTDPTVLVAGSLEAAQFKIRAVTATDPGKDKMTFGYDCNLDGVVSGAAEENKGAANVACDLSGFAPGNYSLMVRVEDSDHEVYGNGIATKPLTITILPAIPTVLDTKPGLYSGKDVTFAFHSTPSTSTIETKLDAAAWAVTTTGARSYAALAEGAHTFMARAVTEGFAGAITSYAWVVDSIGPVTLADSTFSQPVSTDSVTLQFHATDANAAAGFTYTCALDGGTATACTSPLDVGPVFEGSHSLVVSATDAAGNPTTSPTTITWSYWAPPETTLDTSGPAQGSTVSQTTGTFTFSSATATSFQCRVDGGAWTTCTSPYTTPTLGNGSHTVEIRAVRNGVPDATAVSRTWTVDTGAVAQPPVTGSTLSAGNSHGCAVSSGKIYCWGFAGPHLGELVGPPEFNGAYLPTQMGSLTDWASVSAAGSSGHTCGIRTSGALYCWGGNAYGQLGSQTVDTYFGSAAPLTVAVGQTWRKVAAIDSHTCAIRQDQSLWCWGGNGSGEVGIGAASYAVTSPAQVGTATNWIDVGGGYAFTCALNASGALFCWGDGSEGQLGVGATTGFASPLTAAATGVASMTAGGQYVCVVKSNGTLWCWGYNATSQGGNAVTDRTVPSQVGTATDWKLVEAGVNSTCGIKTNGTRWCWGDWTNNALGDDNALSGTQATPVQIGSESDWVELSCGQGFCLGVRGAVTPNVFAWGDNQFNRAGRNADSEPVISPMVQLTPY